MHEGTRGTVVADWTAGKLVERSILHQGHDSEQNSYHFPSLSLAQYILTVQNCSLKHQSCILITLLWGVREIDQYYSGT